MKARVCVCDLLFWIRARGGRSACGSREREGASEASGGPLER
jgi:hypothetical protein